ncbi:hypothetical protein [Streptomyces sp. NPDC002851]
MAGTGEEVADDDALLVLTAVLLTPAQFPSVLGDDYPEACAALGLAPLAEGYGLVLGQDGLGARWTVVVDDVSLVAVAIAAWDCGMEYDLSPSERTVVAALPGWPLSLAVAAPGVPAPHDPEPEPDDEGGRRLLTPPDTSVWGPAQRRLGADEVALQWAAWRAEVDDADFVSVGEMETGGTAGAGTEAGTRGPTPPMAGTGTETGVPRTAGASGTEDGSSTEHLSGTGDPAGSADATDTPEDADASGDADAPHGPQAYDGVRRVLDEARGYTENPPPLGRVRSAFASEDARTLRADGPGWSLVARTDDIAFVLLDEVPGEVLPVGRGPELPGLLDALDKMAVRPS